MPLGCQSQLAHSLTMVLLLLLVARYEVECKVTILFASHDFNVCSSGWISVDLADQRALQQAQTNDAKGTLRGGVVPYLLARWLHSP